MEEEKEEVDLIHIGEHYETLFTLACTMRTSWLRLCATLTASGKT